MDAKSEKKQASMTLADFLCELGNLLSELGNKIKNEPNSQFDGTYVAKLIRNFREDLFKEMKSVPSIHFDREIFPDKESIIDFVKTYYDEKIPKSWIRDRVEQHAADIVSKRGGMTFKDLTNKYLEIRRKRTAQIDVFKMEREEIVKVLMELPTVKAMKDSLPSSLRHLLKGVSNKEYAIKKVTSEIERLRSAGKVMDIF